MRLWKPTNLHVIIGESRCCSDYVLNNVLKIWWRKKTVYICSNNSEELNVGTGMPRGEFSSVFCMLVQALYSEEIKVLPRTSSRVGYVVVSSYSIILTFS